MSNFSERRSHPLTQIITLLSPRARKKSIHSSSNNNPDSLVIDLFKPIIEKRSTICSYKGIQMSKTMNQYKSLKILSQNDQKHHIPSQIIEQYLPSTLQESSNKTLENKNLSLQKSTASTFWKTSLDCQSDTLTQTNFRDFSNILFKKGNIFDSFRVLKQMGYGKFSKVLLVKHIKTGFIAAIKVLSKKNLINQTIKTQLLREVKILSFINHPNITSLYGVDSDSQNIYLIEQMGCDGELFSLLSKKKSFSQQAVSFIMKGLLSAVSYLHQHKILHRDIKPENVVLVHGIVKLCDLGWSVHTNTKFRQTMCGTPLYFSPQLLQGNKYNEKIDLWALGIMAYELRFGKTPFQIKNRSQLSKIITQQIIFPSLIEISEQFQHFIRNLLQKNPKQRLTAGMMLNHPFIIKYKNFETCEQLCTSKSV